mmetsp:Transcript_30452/g.70209  ORF Transcript_30452/g.70209 Transcript_30452/m.70209 type:complete len:333 (-) Transcript_30452:1245-2243(-)
MSLSPAQSGTQGTLPPTPRLSACWRRRCAALPSGGMPPPSLPFSVAWTPVESPRAATRHCTSPQPEATLALSPSSWTQRQRQTFRAPTATRRFSLRRARGSTTVCRRFSGAAPRSLSRTTTATLRCSPLPPPAIATWWSCSSLQAPTPRQPTSKATTPSPPQSREGTQRWRPCWGTPWTSRCQCGRRPPRLSHAAPRLALCLCRGHAVPRPGRRAGGVTSEPTEGGAGDRARQCLVWVRSPARTHRPQTPACPPPRPAAPPPPTTRSTPSRTSESRCCPTPPGGWPLRSLPQRARSSRRPRSWPDSSESCRSHATGRLRPRRRLRLSGPAGW